MKAKMKNLTEEEFEEVTYTGLKNWGDYWLKFS